MVSLKGTLVALVLVASLGIFCEAEDCDKYGVRFYEDIACNPIKTEGKECPSGYDCNITPPENGCVFRGKNYSIGEEIISDFTASICSSICFCSDVSQVTCIVRDCPEWFDPPLQPGCYYQYKLGGCCATRAVCNSTETKTCEVDGKTYQLGQIFYPKNTCYKCVCDENFTGEYDETTCIKKNCLSQKSFNSEISQNCAPLYTNYDADVLCCPDDFVCPDPSDTITIINSNAEKNSTLECSYGAKKLELGEGFRKTVNKYGQEMEVQCECVLPPLLTCKKI